jgi:bacteriocin-like protein
MKKTTRKLMLRKVTVRELSEKALTHVIGGQETDTAAAYPWSRDKQCPIALGSARQRLD